MSARVLVTGGAGYIGSHACKRLAAAGYTPVCVDSLENGHRWAVRWGPFAQLDVRDDTALDRVFAAHRPVAVMHFAGYIQVGESVRQPLKYHRNNLDGLMAVLAVMGRHGVAPIVFSSTAAVYGEPERVPIPEDHPKRPESPYGSSKLACERVLADVAAAGDIRYAALRYFNAAGADGDGEIGEAHLPETHLVPLAVRALRDPAFTLQVFGDDFPTGDGTAVRDYIHVEDLAEAHLRALEYLLAGHGSACLNLGTGHGISVREVLAACARVAGQAPKHTIAGRRAGDVAALVADPAGAQRTLDWRPRLSDIDTIVRAAAAWDRKLHAG
jgi:UDP-glucose-4-epimerase GalE